MTRIRPQSLSGLLSAALLLIVLPLTAALVYGGVQLRELSRTRDLLVQDSITLTQHTQVLHSLITRRQLAIDKGVSYCRRTHTLSLRGACYDSCVIDRIRLSVSAAQRADIDHADLTAPQEGSALIAIALRAGESNNLAHGINAIGSAVHLAF